ncbi:DNA-3-methyladenine glycosylase family protein [Neobacillus sp. SM06]|uniref:DNA-3-methyladenine glycosylase family protein n=1 Tax=Neobacillus sp. SM06 TaxID=3422492 RepID=UPI003D2D4421
MWKKKIQIDAPYNFDRVLERQALDPLNQIDKKHREIKVPIIVNREKYVVEVRGTGTTEAPAFLLSGKKDENKEEQIKRIAEIFQWNVPLKPVYDHFQQTDLTELFNEHFGTPLVLDFDPFSSLLKSIIHQQLNLSFAFTLTERFVKTFGSQLEDVWFYPDAEKIAELTVEQLRELQFSGRKAEYVIGIARNVTGGELDFSALKQEDEEEIFKNLIKIRGVGPWTIQNFLLFGLGRQNLFPTADIGIQNALKKLYKLEQKPTQEEMERFKQGWEPYLSYASLYLWRSIE